MNENKSRILILGAGQAGAQAVMSLRTEGHEGEIVMLGDEIYPPYQRPPLSKKFLSGEMERERLELKSPDFYAQAGVDLRLGTRAVAVERDKRLVHLMDGGALSYDALIIATGSRVREINMPGYDLDGIHYLRSIDDVERLRAHFRPGARLVIVGGGYIGLEVAAVAVKHGIDVTVLETAPRVMARVVDPIISSFYERIHAAEGVRIVTGATVAGFEGKGKVEAVLSGEGDRYSADFVLVGIGILPNVELAENAGLQVENGIVVDQFSRTSDPDIYAAGDCANHPNGIFGRRLRLESVHNAIEQAKTAAASIMGKEKPYDQVPWFWSDQYDLKLQIAGLSTGYTEAVVRGDPDNGRSFAVFYLKDDVVMAVDAINRAPEFMTAKNLIAQRAKIPSHRLRDETIPMKELAKAIV